MPRNAGQRSEASGQLQSTDVETDVARMADELLEKEELIRALTERLEQAAEQLDRHRRSGDRGGLVEGGFPKELVEQHRSLVDEMRLAVQQWQDMQAAASLGRVECQLGELRDLVSSRLDVVVSNTKLIAAGGSPAAASAPTSTHSPAASKSSQRPVTREPVSVADILARMQAEGTTDEEGDVAPEAISDPASNGEGGLETATSSSDQDVPKPSIPVPELPESINIADASVQELREAVKERDATLALFAEYVQSLERFQPPELELTWLAELPDAHREQLLGWQTHWQERLRRTEIELSLERARLSREANALEAREDQLRKDLKRMGKDENRLELDEHAANGQELPRSKNWLNLFGNRSGQT